MKETIWIEADRFHGNAILNSNVPPYGYGLEHIQDINTEKMYTIIFKGDKNYAYEEKPDGSVIFNH